MTRSRNKKIALAALALTVALAIQLTPPTRINASDHIDSPSITHDRSSDIADLYAFVDPNDKSKVVLLLSTQGFVVSGEHFGMAIFDHNIRYRFEIENTGDAKPDSFIDVLYSPGLGRVTTQMATIEFPDGRKFTAPTTASTQEYATVEPVVTNNAATGVSFYAGVSDDPFFLDDTGANRFVASSIANPGHPDKKLLGERGRDTYAGFNTMLTALSVPADMMRGKSGNVIGINAVTQRKRNQRVEDNGEVKASGDWITVDRSGTPLVNNGLVPPPRKNQYNAASTEDDAKGMFKADLVKSLKGLGTDDAHIAMLAKGAVEKGDILRLDLSVPNKGSQGGNNPNGGFGKMGGRRLVDDVVDMTFTIINNGVPMGDRVDANQVPFRNSFPFVANAIQPFRPGSGAEDQTRQ